MAKAALLNRPLVLVPLITNTIVKKTRDCNMLITLNFEQC